MVSIVTKKIKGQEYLYLVHSVRKGTKVIQNTVKYIGKKRPVSNEEFQSMEYSYNRSDWILCDYVDYLSYQDHAQLKNASKNSLLSLRSLDSTSREKEKEKFLSVFISNSNAIEGSTLSVKDTFNFLFNDIIPAGHSKKEMHMAINMKNAWDYLELNYKKFPTIHDMQKLHVLVNVNIESGSTLGRLKRVQNYIGDEITSSYLFTSERMDELFFWIKRAYARIDDFEVAFQSHAQFEIIHPFVDGNGRVGRLLINWLLMYKRYQPLAISVNKRADYISALNNSKRGNVVVICKFLRDEYLNYYRFI